MILLDGEEKFASESKEMTLARGEENKVTFVETINLANGENYIVRLLAGDVTVGERTGIKVSGHSAVSELEGEGFDIAINDNEIRLLGGKAARIEVYSTDGRLAAAAADADTLDISGLGNGAYILRIYGSDSVKALKFNKK